MSLTACSECSHQVSRKAKSCPKCGAPVSGRIKLKYVLINSVLLIVFWVFAFLVFSDGHIVEFSEYKKIKNGMSYRQVVKIIGTEGEQMSSNKFPGVPGVMSSIYTEVYQWTNWDGTGMNAIFQNGKLIQKSQYGLP